MDKKKLFDRIDTNPKYAEPYREKLKSTYEWFEAQGYEFSEHALGRVLGQRKSAKKRTFTKEEVCAILTLQPNFIDDGTKWVRFYYNISILQDMGSGKIITVNSQLSPSMHWEAIEHD